MTTTFKFTMRFWQQNCQGDIVRIEQKEHDNRSTLSAPSEGWDD